jgi:hypothetical protein
MIANYERSFSPWRLHIQLMAQYVNEFWRAVAGCRLSEPNETTKDSATVMRRTKVGRFPMSAIYRTIHSATRIKLALRLTMTRLCPG